MFFPYVGSIVPKACRPACPTCTRFNSLTVTYSEPPTLLATLKKIQKGLPFSAWLVVVNVPDALLWAVEIRPWAWDPGCVAFFDSLAGLIGN